MGIKKGSVIAKAAASSVTNDPVIVPASAGPDVFAIDANSMIYSAYETLYSQIAKEDGVTTLSSMDVMKKLVTTVVDSVVDLVKTVEPEILIIAFDGVPPLTKIMDQRVRRIDAPPNDLFDSERKLVFSTSWICPNSVLMMYLDEAFSHHPAKGKLATIFSGPGVVGEGEHKIYPMLQALCKYGLEAIPKGAANITEEVTSGVTSRNASWRPKIIYIFGNDNDFFILSALFLVTFTKDAPKVFLYNDLATRRTISAEASEAKKSAGGGDGEIGGSESNEPARGVLKLGSKVAMLQMFDISYLLNAIVGDGKFSAPGRSRIDKVLHFVHLSSLMGNDFLPQVQLTAGTEINAVELFKTILIAASKTGPYLPELVNETKKTPEKKTVAPSGPAGGTMPSTLAASSSPSAAAAAAASGPPAESQLPLICNDENKLAFIMYHNNHERFRSVMNNIEIAIELNHKQICDVPYNPNVVQNNLLEISEVNGLMPSLSNDVAIAASCDYIRIMDNVLSYYVSTCCAIPKRVNIVSVETMPMEYYAYGRAPPSFKYLVAGAQIQAAIQQDGALLYKNTRAAIEAMGMSGIDHAVAPVPGRYVEVGFQSALVFPARTLDYCLVPGQMYIPPSAYAAASRPIFSMLYPIRTNPKANSNLVPLSVLLHLETMYMTNMTPATAPRLKLGSTVLTTEAGTIHLGHSNYVRDALL